MRRRGREWAAAARAAEASREANPAPPCYVCQRTRTKGLLCPSCSNSTIAADRKAAIAQLLARKEELLQEMNPLLETRKRWQDQDLRRRRMEESLREASLNATDAEHELRRVRSTLVQLASKNESRSQEISDLIQELPGLRTKNLVHNLPDVIRCHGLTHSMAMEKLVNEQRKFLQQLLVLFPLQITALRSSTGAAPPGTSTVLPIPCVTVANLRIPDSMEQILAGSEQTQQTSGAALGYMLQLTKLLSDYLGAPDPYSSSFNGSYSTIWEPASSSDPSPLPGTKPLPLYVSLRGSMAADLSHVSASAAKALNAAKASASSAPSGPSSDPEQTAEAVRLLERSVAMLCHATMGAAASTCPEEWSPFAMLAWMFAQVKLQNTETTQRIMAAATASASSSTSGPPPQRRPLDPWMCSDAGPSAQMLLGDPLAPSINDHDHDPDHPESEDWDLVQPPYLPPPPSQPEEVEHWTRAMFTDALRAKGSSAASGSSGSGSGRASAVDGLFGAISRLPSFGGAASRSGS